MTGAAREIYLSPGQMWFGSGDVVLRTLLGSCVAVTVWHERWRTGGMCHYLLPRREAAPADEPDGRYGEEALAWLARQLQRIGARAPQVQTKLFGGGRMFATGGDPAGEVQQRNVALARAWVAAQGLRVCGEHLGGDGHRQVVFQLRSGEVWLRHTPLDSAPGELA
ncbi:MAG: chemotaxis protein CheD [Pseudomonadota bacterium]